MRSVVIQLSPIILLILISARGIVSQSSHIKRNPTGMQIYSWFPEADLLEETKKNDNTPFDMPWDTAIIDDMVEDWSQRSYGQYDLCTTPWDNKTFKLDIQLRDRQGQPVGIEPQFWRPFGYHRSRLIACDVEENYSVRLVNLNSVLWVPADSLYNVTVPKHKDSYPPISWLPGPEKYWKKGVRIFCRDALKIADELKEAMMDDAKEIVDATNEDRFPEVKFFDIGRNDVPEPKSYLETDDYKLAGASFWNEDDTWAVTIGYEKHGCPSTKDRSKWIVRQDAREVKGFYPPDKIPPDDPAPKRS